MDTTHAPPRETVQRMFCQMEDAHQRNDDLARVYLGDVATRPQALEYIVRMVTRADITQEERDVVRVLRKRHGIGEETIVGAWRRAPGSPADGFPPGLRK